MAHFKVKKITNLDNLLVDSELPESDFSHMSKSGDFIQFEYVPDEVEQITPVIVKPGIWAIQTVNNRISLVSTSFTNDSLLKEFLYTQEIKNKIDSFFKNLPLYKEFGIEVPRRAAFIYGPAGTGKTTALKEVIREYVSDGKTAAILYPTDNFEPFDIKNFIKAFDYEGVEKPIFLMEDLGGVEVKNVDIPSDPSLLALLDNSEKIFKIPVYVASTTNFPEIFASNLANRPGRFDDKIKVPYPPAEYRVKLLKFFMKDREITPEVTELIESNKTKEFSPAHIRESVIRSVLHDKTLETVVKEIIFEIEVFNKSFEEKGKFGINA